MYVLCVCAVMYVYVLCVCCDVCVYVLCVCCDVYVWRTENDIQESVLPFY